MNERRLLLLRQDDAVITFIPPTGSAIGLTTFDAHMMCCRGSSDSGFGMSS